MKCTLLIFLVTYLLFPASVFAKESPPPDPKTEQIESLSGMQMLSGWNYFSLTDQACPLEVLFSELQADAGGAVYVDTLWAKPEKKSWTVYSYGKIDLLTSIPKETLIAIQSTKKFYFDMASSACAEAPKSKRMAQIASVRAVAQASTVEVRKIQEETDRKIIELQRVPSPLEPLRNWFSDLWQTLVKFLKQIAIKI